MENNNKVSIKINDIEVYIYRIMDITWQVEHYLYHPKIYTEKEFNNIINLIKNDLYKTSISINADDVINILIKNYGFKLFKIPLTGNIGI